MNRKMFLALSGAILALVLAPGAGALVAGGTSVTVRVEGLKRTLLVATVVHTHTGSVTKGGTPKGKCPATSAAGALDVATHHKWDGKYSTTVNDIFITKILGEFQSGKKYFWSIFVNNVSSTTGACAVKLKHGDRLLFAVVPSSVGAVHPLALKAPRHAKVGHAFTLTVVSFDAKGKSSPLAGAHVRIGKAKAVTDSHGVVHVDPTHKGSLVLRAEKTGFVRAAALRVSVS